MIQGLIYGFFRQSVLPSTTPLHSVQYGSGRLNRQPALPSTTPFRAMTVVTEIKERIITNSIRIFLFMGPSFIIVR